MKVPTETESISILVRTASNFVPFFFVRSKAVLTGLDGMPKGKLPPRASWVVVGHEMQPLSMLGNIRKPNIQQGLRSSRPRINTKNKTRRDDSVMRTRR